MAVSGNSSSNVDIVVNLFLSASVRSTFPGRTLTAVLNPASKAAFASARKTHGKRTLSLSKFKRAKRPRHLPQCSKFHVLPIPCF